jgi:hypothetical protein
MTYPRHDLIGILLTQTQVNQPDVFRPFLQAVYTALQGRQRNVKRRQMKGNSG